MNPIIIDELIPGMESSYESLVEWLLSQRESWTIRGVPRKSFSDFKKPNSGNALTKREIVEFITQTFVSTLTPELEYNGDIEDKYYVFEIEYIGNGNIIKIDTEDFGPIILSKNIPVPVYDKNCHLLEIVRSQPENFRVLGRDLYTHEAQLLETYNQLKAINNTMSHSNKFFDIY
jgi:hypothetical protein